MKKFINKPEHIVHELLEGFALSHPDKIRLLAELARDRRILVAVDEAENAAAHSAAAVSAGSALGIFVEVEGAGDYLPPYAGNLDIMTAAATRVGEALAQRRADLSARS